ncbi:MAG: hypothetical protein A2V81_01235 [Candidatus Abawacabacteria bacterium RBG_16_42_10]|uniref:Calx-beta domain-containing protein n=1 Tax=Candidatus Abawacabacteria bacterium RBG_16_42_10 TaxID=1817814 RepID=A0A1F4XIP1_9BACT|nr:MAG: hypothetical protein A2V81_01235 [Candidatus Abawacabacteria bacterium RBG_16_42_10]
MKIGFPQRLPPPTNRSYQSFKAQMNRLMRILLIAMMLVLSLPYSLMSQVNAQVTTSQDRTVVTLDVTASCSTSIIDTLSTNDGPRGDDQPLHDDDDTLASAFQDGFDEQTPTPTVDFSDNEFSTTARTTGGLSGSGFEPSGVNILVDDPNAPTGDGDNGSGYVDLELFDTTGNSYAAVFNDQITCDTVNGYDLHIGDTFNMDPTSNKVNYDVRDIAIDDQTYKPNLNKREGLFRIAPNSDRDIIELDLPFGFETNYIKHEYVMDLPAVKGCPVVGVSIPNDDYAGDCVHASLDPFTALATERLRTWPYAVSTPPDDNDFGTVGFTLLCDQNGGPGAAVAGTGKINPFTRGLALPGTSQNRRFREDGGNVDCHDASQAPEEYYAAIPSLLSGADYDGISGTDPGTYGAILSANNWVGYSGFITASVPAVVDNYFEVRAQVPNNQIAGTYAGTIILSCLPNLTADNKADFDGDPSTVDDPDPISFLTATSSGDEGVTPVNIPVSLSEVQAVSVTADYTITGGTAVNGVDYILPVTGTITFNPGEQLTYIPAIIITDDNDIEGDETIEITLSNPQPPFIYLGDIIVHTYTILDNDFGGGIGGGAEMTCFGPYNWTSGFNFSQDCGVTAGGSHALTFSTDSFCDSDNNFVTLLGADGTVLYSDSCSGGLDNNTIYNVGPLSEDTTGDATLVLSDGFGDGGILNILWTYQP